MLPCPSAGCGSLRCRWPVGKVHSTSGALTRSWARWSSTATRLADRPGGPFAPPVDWSVLPGSGRAGPRLCPP
jgi:hypothetical protein